MVRFEVFPPVPPPKPVTIESLQVENQRLKKQLARLATENVALMKTIIARRNDPESKK